MFYLCGIVSLKQFFDMKKQLIATLVGGILLFLWQFLSWALIPVHKAEYGYTPNQDKIIEALNQNLTEEGTYMLPMPAPGSSSEQQQATMESYMGKPWAQVTYHKAMSTEMGMNMFRGLVIDFVAVWLFIWLLSGASNLSIATVVPKAVAVGVIGYLTIPYLNSIWFETSSLAHLVDAFVSWGAVGAWLGWWLPRE